MGCEGQNCECQWCRCQRAKFTAWMRKLWTPAGAGQVRAILAGDRLSVGQLARRWGHDLGYSPGVVQKGLEGLLQQFPEGREGL